MGRNYLGIPRDLLDVVLLDACYASYGLHTLAAGSHPAGKALV
jgi:hypothetical protein